MSESVCQPVALNFLKSQFFQLQSAAIIFFSVTVLLLGKC